MRRRRPSRSRSIAIARPKKTSPRRLPNPSIWRPSPRRRPPSISKRMRRVPLPSRSLPRTSHRPRRLSISIRYFFHFVLYAIFSHKSFNAIAFSFIEAIVSALIVDAQIRHEWNTYGNKVNIFAQVMDYCFVGAGEIFAISTAYEAAFIIAPKEQKVRTNKQNNTKYMQITAYNSIVEEQYCTKDHIVRLLLTSNVVYCCCCPIYCEL